MEEDYTIRLLNDSLLRMEHSPESPKNQEHPERCTDNDVLESFLHYLALLLGIGIVVLLVLIIGALATEKKDPSESRSASPIITIPMANPSSAIQLAATYSATIRSTILIA